MPLDPSIYGLLDTKGLQSGLQNIATQYMAGQDRKAQLSQLARQNELTDMQIRAGQRAEAALPEQKRQKDMQELSTALAFGIKQKNGISNQDLMNRTYEEAMRRGLKDEDVAQLFQPWESVRDQTDGEAVADVYLQKAYPAEAAKQRMEAMNMAPQKIDEGSPVTVMQAGKPVTIMSKSGRFVGEALPPAALVNIGNLGQPFEVTKDGEKKLVQMDKAGKIVEVPGGYGPKEGKEKSLTEGQAKATTFASQMASASNELDALEKKGFDPTKASTQFETGVAGGMGNVFTSAQAQQAKQSQNQWSEAFLRVKTGAAATLPEVELNNKTFFPQVGDTKDVVEQKRRMRIQAERDTLNMAGPGREMATKRSALKQETKYDADKEDRYQAWKASQGIR